MVKKLYEIYKDDTLKAAEDIQRLRMQIAIHKYIHELHLDIVEDAVYDEWVVRYNQYKKDNLKLVNEVESTIPFDENKVVEIANWLLSRRESSPAKQKPKPAKRKLF